MPGLYPNKGKPFNLNSISKVIMWISALTWVTVVIPGMPFGIIWHKFFRYLATRCCLPHLSIFFQTEVMNRINRRRFTTQFTDVSYAPEVWTADGFCSVLHQSHWDGRTLCAYLFFHRFPKRVFGVLTVLRSCNCIAIYQSVPTILARKEPHCLLCEDDYFWLIKLDSKFLINFGFHHNSNANKSILVALPPLVTEPYPCAHKIPDWYFIGCIGI